MSLVTLCWKVCVRVHMFCTIMCIYVYKVSYFVFFFLLLLQIITKLKPSLADIRRKGLCLSLIFSAARFRLLSDLHIAEQGACRALRAGSLIVEGKKKKKNLAGIQTGERSALLIIVSSLQVSQLTVGGGWGRGR